jgi:hypothetical protein
MSEQVKVKTYIEDIVSDPILMTLLEDNGFKDRDSKGYYFLAAMIGETAKDITAVMGSICEFRKNIAKNFGIAEHTVERTVDHVIRKNDKFLGIRQKSVVNKLAGEYISIKRGISNEN